MTSEMLPLALASLLERPRDMRDRITQLAELARRLEELTRAAQAGADVLEHHACLLQGRTARRIRRAAAALHRPL